VVVTDGATPADAGPVDLLDPIVDAVLAAEVPHGLASPPELGFLGHRSSSPIHEPSGFAVMCLEPGAEG